MTTPVRIQTCTVSCVDSLWPSRTGGELPRVESTRLVDGLCSQRRWWGIRVAVLGALPLRRILSSVVRRRIVSITSTIIVVCPLLVSWVGLLLRSIGIKFRRRVAVVTILLWLAVLGLGVLRLVLVGSVLTSVRILVGHNEASKGKSSVVEQAKRVLGEKKNVTQLHSLQIPQSFRNGIVKIHTLPSEYKRIQH